MFNTFETPIWNGKQNSLTGPVITGNCEKRAPGLEKPARVRFRSVVICEMSSLLVLAKLRGFFLTKTNKSRSPSPPDISKFQFYQDRGTA